ncbi:MAG: CHAT domain-containing protein [Saprospiraceae bacterium]|nr:CHAT domain-containing protein [Saprospiraceae bacterium]
MIRIIICCSFLLVGSISYSQNQIIQTIDSLYDSKNYSELIEIAEQYIGNGLRDDYITSKLKYDLSNSYYKSGDFVSCWKYIRDAYEQVLNLELSDSTDVELFIDIAQRLGDYSFQAEEHKIGREALEKAIKIGEEKLKSDAWRMGKLYHKSGAIYRIMTQFENAIAHLEIGQQYLPKLPIEKEQYLSTVFLSEMAQVYNDNNQLNKSIEIFKTILKTAEEEENIKRLSIYNNNIGIAYERKGDYGKAEYHFRKSLEAKFKIYGEKTPKIISNYTNLGKINTRLGRYEEAQMYYTKLDALISEVFEKDHIKNSDTQFNLGLSYYQQNQYKKALPHFLEAVRIRSIHKSKDDLILAEAQYQYGATLSKLGEFDKALPILKKALEIRANGIQTQDTERMKILVILSEIHWKMNLEEEALAYLNQSFDALNFSKKEPFAFDKIENPLGMLHPLILQLQILSEKIVQNPIQNYFQEGEFYSQVSDSLIQYIKYKYDDVASRRVATSNIQDLNEALLFFNYVAMQESKDQKYVSQAFQIIERSNNTFLYEALAEDNSVTRYGLPQEIINRKSTLQDSIAILHQKIESFPIDVRTQSNVYASYLSQLNTHKNALYTLINTIETDYPMYYKSIYKNPTITIEKIKSQLTKNEVILSYFNGKNEIYGLAISGNNVQFLSLGNSKTIEHNISRLLTTLESRSMSNTYLSSSKELHSKLIKPFDLPSNSSISIIADDALNLIPFEILIDEQINLPMVLTHFITYQYSTSLKFNSASSTSGKNALLMAPIFKDNQTLIAQNFNVDDRYRNDLGYLPETENEVLNIHAMIGGDLFLHHEANESNFKAIAPGKALLHLATHGFVDNSNPDFSKLHFSNKNDSINDGLLHAHEIVQMDLSADLVTLSACNTGTGKIQNGEGISSLGRAFAYANCPNQLISLWPANDNSTTQLMTLYYKNVNNGMGKSQALTQAKRTYLSTAPEVYKHPYYWAGFIYYGQDTPLKLGPSFPFWAYGLVFISIGVFTFLYRKKISSFFI